MIKKILLLSILLPVFSYAQKLHLPKQFYEVGEEVIVSYNDLPELLNSWIVLKKIDENRQLNTTDYLVGNGTWSNQIHQPGNYSFEIRYEGNTSYKPDERYDFVVVEKQ